MPQPRPAAATESRKAVCLCCRKRLHPTTVWRHAQVAATAEAFQEAGSSRIPPSYPRASFVLSSRRLVPPSGEDVSGLAQSMEAAHLSEHDQGPQDDDLDPRSQDATTDDQDDDTNDQDDEDDSSTIGDISDDELTRPIPDVRHHGMYFSPPPSPPPGDRPDSPSEFDNPQANDGSQSTASSSHSSTSSSSDTDTDDEDIFDLHPDDPRYNEIKQLMAGWALHPLDGFDPDDEWRLESNRLRIQEGLPRESPEFRMIKAYKLQMETNTGARTFAKWRYTFPELDLPSLKVIRREMALLSGLDPIIYHCCPKVCICYAGPFAKATVCPYCKHPRYKRDGAPANTFHYLPLTPQLQALFAGRTSAKAMRYRARHHDDNTNNAANPITDIYDSELYRELRTKYVVVNDHVLPHKYFEGEQDVCLSKATDGFQIFKHSNKTCWPILLINDNLAYDGRFKLSSVICVGIIPGPNKPKHFDSFIYPLTQELNTLAIGVRSYDAYADTMFTLRAYAPFGSGDMPACAAAWTGGKHPGAKRPCRCCPIEGIRIRGTRNQSHYLPLVRPRGYPVYEYDYDHLPPLREHDEYLDQAREVDSAETEVEAKRLSQLYGINGTPMTANIPGVKYPWSYPFDLMHLIEGSFKNYNLLFTGNFKGLDAGREDYILPANIQKEIASIVVGANKTIPAAFGRPIPNFVDERSFFTAEAWLVFSTLIAPIVFRGRFTRPKYYHHFCLFVSIVNRLISWTSTAADRAQLREDINKWHKEYMDIFYQHNADRLTTCVSTVHAWLHAVDSLEKSGPGPCFWCWVCERVCGHFARAVSSRKHPYASLNRRALEEQTLAMIRNKYDLQSRLPVYSRLNDPRPGSWYRSREYPDITLLHPRSSLYLAAAGFSSLRTRLAAHLATQLNRPASLVKAHLPEHVTQYGRLDIEHGDRIHSNQASLLPDETRRDATFIQYEQLVDRHARNRRRRPEFVGETFFGQLDRILLVTIDNVPELGIPVRQDFILLDVHSCRTRLDRYGFYEYTNFGLYEVISGNSVRSVVGRIFDRNKWVIVQRHSEMDFAEYTADDED